MNTQSEITVTREVVLDNSRLSELVLEIKRDHFEAHKFLQFGVLRLYILGEKLLQLRELFREVGRRDFGAWIYASFPEISYNSILNYIALARVRRAGFQLMPPIDVANHPEFQWLTLYELGRSNLDEHQEVRKMFLSMLVSGADVNPSQVQEYKEGLIKKDEAFNLDALLPVVTASRSSPSSREGIFGKNNSPRNMPQHCGDFVEEAEEVNEFDCAIASSFDLLKKQKTSEHHSTIKFNVGKPLPLKQVSAGTLFLANGVIALLTKIGKAYLVNTGEELLLSKNSLVQPLKLLDDLEDFG